MERDLRSHFRESVGRATGKAVCIKRKHFDALGVPQDLLVRQPADPDPEKLVSLKRAGLLEFLAGDAPNGTHGRHGNHVNQADKET
jgi:hypothetical protein